MNGDTILIVEDDPIQNRQIARALVSSGYSVATAATGLEAMRILAEESVCIVLTDRQMPGMDGLELAEQIKANYPEILVALITACPDEDGNGYVDAHLSKPFGQEDLMELVQVLSGRMRFSVQF